MESRFFFKNMASEKEAELSDYLQKKLPKLQKLVGQFPEDGVNLSVNAKRFHKHDAYEVELILKLASHTFVGKEASHAIAKAIDLAMARLTGQLSRFEQEKIRKHRSLKMKTRVRTKESRLTFP